jgi:hypothetical protein
MARDVWIRPAQRQRPDEQGGIPLPRRTIAGSSAATGSQLHLEMASRELVRVVPTESLDGDEHNHARRLLCSLTDGVNRDAGFAPTTGRAGGSGTPTTALRLQVWKSFAAALRLEPARTSVDSRGSRRRHRSRDRRLRRRVRAVLLASFRTQPSALRSPAPSVVDYRFERGSELLALIGPWRDDP